jgi:integrase/recombinase XerD
MRDIRAFCYWCKDSARGYLKSSFKISIAKPQDEGLKLFTDAKLKTLLERPRKGDSFTEWRTWVIVNWVLATGNRAATICELKIGDVDFYQKEIVLRHTKNKHFQIIPLSDFLNSVLREYLKMWRHGEGEEGWLFPNVGNEQLTTNALRQAFIDYCYNRGVERHNIHGLRHNFAKGWVRNNGNMYALQKVLGHSDLSMTKKYVNLFSEDLKKDYDNYNPLATMKKGSRRTHAITRCD